MNLSLSDITLRPIVKTLGGRTADILRSPCVFCWGHVRRRRLYPSNFGLFEQPQSFVPGEDVVLPKDASITEETDIGQH